MRVNALGVLATVADLSSGAAFGELNLMLWDRRPTPLVARRPSLFGILDYTWFRRLLYPGLHALHAAKRAYFARIPYLRAVRPPALDEIAYLAEVRQFRSGDVVFQQGQVMPASVLFIQSGRVRIIRELAPAGRRASTARSTASSSSRLASPAPLSRPGPRPLSCGAVGERRRPRSVRPGTAAPVRAASTSGRGRPGDGRSEAAGPGRFLDCCVVEFMTALGEIVDDRQKVQYRWRISAIAADRTVAYEVPNHLLLPYADLISPNLYRCPPDVRLRRRMKLTQAWDAYRARIRGPADPGFFGGRHAYRVVQAAARPCSVPDQIGDFSHQRRTTGLMDALELARLPGYRLAQMIESGRPRSGSTAI